MVCTHANMNKYYAKSFSGQFRNYSPNASGQPIMSLSCLSQEVCWIDCRWCRQRFYRWCRQRQFIGYKLTRIYFFLKQKVMRHALRLPAFTLTNNWMPDFLLHFGCTAFQTSRFVFILLPFLVGFEITDWLLRKIVIKKKPNEVR